MKEVKEILRKNINGVSDIWQYGNAIEELSTLIQQEREEAIKEFVEWFNDNNDKEYWLVEEDIQEYLSQQREKGKE